MNQDEIKPMEEEITSEETVPQTNQQEKEQKPKVKLPKIKLHFTVTKPKIITLVILFMIIMVTYFALLLLASNSQENNLPATVTDTTSYSPKPSIDPQIADLTNKVDAYNKQLDTLDNYQKKLAPPSVQLDISFEK